MKPEHQAQIEELLELGQNWVNATRKIGAEEGIHRLLSQLYPDQAHFIYELLQNAEDAGATKVEFCLKRKLLTCKHNGSRLFSFSDVKSITSIGESTKRDDLNKIGKFGVGFKAVFAYTNSPRVLSGDYAFEIRDLVCPHPVDKPAGLDPHTLFVFPFNRLQNPAANCFMEIADTLDNLSENTLMFLDNIKQIEWSVEGGADGKVCSIVHSEGLLQIEHQSGQKKNRSTFWLRYQSVLDDEDKLRVAIAFSLAFRDKKNNRYSPKAAIKEQFVITPADGCLCIFFPADKETTGLRFHLHGPYASTVARDSIPHSAENQKLVVATGKLLSSVLSEIKALGLLDRDFLGVLPNKDDKIDAFYQPLFDAVSEKMQKCALIPTDSGSFEKTPNLVVGPAALRNLLGQERLSFFLDDNSMRWAIGCLQNSLPDKFLHSLALREWGWVKFQDALGEKFEHGIDAEESEQSELWLNAQDDKWIAQLYLTLGRAIDDEYINEYMINDCRIVRLDDDSHVKGKDAFFADTVNPSKMKQLPTVKDSIFAQSTENNSQKIVDFLKAIGVKDFDQEQEVRLILKKWYAEGTDCPDMDEHRKHIALILSFFDSVSSRQKMINPIEIFNGYYLFLDEMGKSFMKPTDYYLDEPFLSTGLGCLHNKGIAGFDAKARLWEGYLDFKDNGFIEFASKVGVCSKLFIERCSTYLNPAAKDLRQDYHRASRGSDYQIDRDYKIEPLGEIISCKDIDVARVLWTTMCQADKAVLVAQYRPNSKFETRTADSMLVHLLKNGSWIPSKDDNYYKPASMKPTDLPDGFVYDDSNGWLTAIDFGAEIYRATDEFKQRKSAYSAIGVTEEMARKLEGLSAKEKAAFWADAAKVYNASSVPTNHELFSVDEYDEKLFAAFSNSSHNPLTESRNSNVTDVPNPERRREKEKEALGYDISAEPKPNERFQMIPRKVWDKKDSEIRVFLENEYGGKCQVCDFVFSKRSGAPYFVAYHLVPQTFAKWTDRAANVLCLCANCAAKLQHGSVSVERLEEQILGARLSKEGGDGRLSVKITLCDQPVEITFSERHILALQELLKRSISEITSNEPPSVPIVPQSEPKSTQSKTVKSPARATCPECGCKIKPTRLERHLKKVHRKRAGRQPAKGPTRILRNGKWELNS